MRHVSAFTTLAIALTLISQPATAQVAATVPAPGFARAWEQVVAAEDARAGTPEQLRTLMEGTRSADPALRAISVRALGRLQRVSLVDSIMPFLANADPRVRAQAAMAIAQSHTNAIPEQRVRDALVTALSTEHPRELIAIGGIAEALGLLRNADAASTRAIAAVLTGVRPGVVYTDHGSNPDSHAAPLGIVRGLHFLARQPPALRQGLDTARSALISFAKSPLSRVSSLRASEDRVRSLAAQTIALAGFGDSAVAYTLLSDPSPMVRREAVAVAGTIRDTALVRRINARALQDDFWMVRHDALRQYATGVLRTGPCSLLTPHARATRGAAEGPEQHVRNAALQLMGGPCTSDVRSIAFLDSVAGSLGSAPSHAWHAPAHALVALAAKDAASARRRLPSFATHANQFVRTYAATAAGTLRDTAPLYILARDRSPNVRTAAVQALDRLVGHDADSVYIAQLALDDSQLLMAAAVALDSTRSPRALTAALDALDRVSALRSETSRDGRAALLKLIGDLRVTTDLAPVPRLNAYLRDFDAVIAGQAADILQTWTGSRPVPQPVPLGSSVRRPSYDEAVQIARTVYVIEMLTGETYEVTLFPFDAPVNAARFAQQVRDGWFNGLTFHRVEPSFVVQGGSPGANEYAGAALFSRDELGRANWRGTIGLSTRGHDTGDAQIFINSIDNVRLDPSYTVFGQLTNRTSAADAILEGAVIRSVTIRP